MTNDNITITALGCTGEVAAHIVEGFLRQPNVKLQLLARNPSYVKQRYQGNTNLHVIPGSMANADDVARAVDGADVAFCITPMGKNNDTAFEIDVARRMIQGCQQGKLKHLVYASVLKYPNTTSTGVGILDAKSEIEAIIQASGVPHTILRCGSYLEDVFDPRINLLRKGIFLFPIDKRRSFNYTGQQDIPPFVVQHLAATPDALKKSRILDFIEPKTYTLHQVEESLSLAAGHKIWTVPRFPYLYLFKGLLPLFRWRKHRFSSVIPLMVYFDQFGYTGDTNQMKTHFPGFTMTSLDKHVSQLLGPSNPQKQD